LKKIFAASAVLVIIFIVLYLTGAVDLKNTINKSLIEGNRLYSEEQYSEALASYQKGLSKDPGHDKLNYNAAQVSYMLQNYEQAAEYYGKAAHKVDTYINRGNSYFNAGENLEDINHDNTDDFKSCSDVQFQKSHYFFFFHDSQYK
jgi:tetratricopeptide (TPR) repeat protein